MSNLEQFNDMTGMMSQDDINAENISNIIDELNRTSDSLDSLNQTLSIVAYGTLTYSWDGSGSGATPTTATLQTGIATQGNFIGLSYMSRDIDNPTIYVNMPYFRSIENANGDSVMDKLFQASVNSDSGIYEIDLNFFASGSPIDYTFYYILFQQPSNLPS